ncbi:pyruvate formate lyase-domain-containing protein [Chaetomidium leptoderma]|uniref:Pyruvate formate lyase-domain-containing protein n=1 Tax=Chaetomidium leptoderma TaxID=669021 RepID=A0AAN6VD46_9PEZI|nr:pyruvate formate lyase-domain-containing protein [Chaetomidium leptoderma]
MAANTEQLDDTLLGAQRGLLMRAVFGQALTLYLKDKGEGTCETVLGILREMSKNIVGNHPGSGLVAAFSPELWGKWQNRSIPISTENIDRFKKFTLDQGDVLIFVKAPNHKTAESIVSAVYDRLDALSDRIELVKMGKRKDTRIMGGRYVDAITNPNDPVSLAEDILVGHPERGGLRGSCFGFTQKFEFDWPGIATQAADTQDEMIGRNPDGAALPQHAVHSHVHRAAIRNANGDQLKLLRQALPYGSDHKHAGREEGIMFVAFCNDQQRFEDILANLIGQHPERPVDKLMTVVHGVSGGYWYVPAAAELKVPAVVGPQDVYEDPHWQVASPNGYLFYNSRDYLHQMAEGRYVGGDPPSRRLLSLMARAFSHWRDSWMKRQVFPRLPHLETLVPADDKGKLITTPVPVRKGMANQQTLAHLLSDPKSDIARDNGLLRIEAKELIVGVIPDFTLGRGKEVVPYLSEDETMAAWLKASLNEWSSMGHIVPDYDLLVKSGLGGLIKDLQDRLEKLPQKDDATGIFYNSCIISLEGVQGYLRNWAQIAEQTASDAAKASAAEDEANMEEVAARLHRLVDHPPESFHDAVQLIYSFHCCLHLVGELTPFGRLDQILYPFLAKGGGTPLDQAQDIIDCLWVKIGENAFVNRAFIQDYVTYGTTAVCGLGGNFPQGGGINQWVQQITVGGYKATDGDKPEGGANDVTMLCLKAARRIPVNAPTLSLRVYKDMPDKYLDEAATGILSGGAQPIMYNDDKLCRALKDSAPSGVVDASWSRNYAADGCYEPMLAGASEFTFNNVAPLLALEQTINEGATYGGAGPEQLRGLKQTFRSKPAKEFESFEDLKETFLKQLEWLVVQCYNTMLGAYGNLADICPSPLLSVLIEGCVQKGRDLTNGGSKFHIMAPLCVGISNTIDSLYAIQKLVFDEDTARVTLPELVKCLMCDWGHGMIEPFENQLSGTADASERGLRYTELRNAALALPKWGSGNEEVNELGNWLVEKCVDLCVDAIRNPNATIGGLLDGIKKAHGQDFEFVVCPGIGTFEGYVGDGIPCGASADGRRSGMPIASDLSPVPAAQDLPASPVFRNIYQAMKSTKYDSIEYGLSNASPVDMNIPEAFPLDELQRFVKKYAAGDVGSNLITLTCADLDTYEKSVKDPEKYNLVRVRMGGWTEFYATMFPAHQEQHQRRQYFTPWESGKTGAKGAVVPVVWRDEDACEDAAPKPRVMLNELEVRS